MNDKETIKELRRQIRIKDDSLHAKNLELDALHYVWCSGGCARGVHRWTKEQLTEEIVQKAELNAKRLRQWIENHKYRERNNKQC